MRTTNGALLSTAALTYHTNGWSVLPVGPNKQPLCKFKHWFTRRQSEAEMRALPWEQGYGIAVLCWPGSDLLVVDFDEPCTLPAWKETNIALPDTAIVQTPHRGAHAIYRMPPTILHPGLNENNGHEVRRAIRLIKATCDCKDEEGKPHPCGVDLLLNGYFVTIPTPGYRPMADCPLDPAQIVEIPPRGPRTCASGPPRESESAGIEAPQ